MKRYERLAGLILIAVGIASALYAAQTLKLGTPSRPDSGFLPFIASLLLVVVSAQWVIGALGRDEHPQPFWEPGSWVRPLLALGLMVLYAVAMEPIGYALSTLAFMLAWQLGVERERVVKGAVVAVVATGVMWALFSYLLGVPLPEGLLAEL